MVLTPTASMEIILNLPIIDPIIKAGSRMSTNRLGISNNWNLLGNIKYTRIADEVNDTILYFVTDRLTFSSILMATEMR